jgi:hypothetical protein
MSEQDEVMVIRISNPADLVEKLTGVRPHSGTCMFCKKALTATDIDHSVCNSCWDETFKHTWEDYNGECNICDETWDNPIHIRKDNHVHNFEPLDETKVILDRYCPFCGYREVL